MGFIRFEDRTDEGPKFDRIPSAAGWLHVCACLYASRTLTDGFIPAGRVYKLTNDPPAAVDKAVKWLTTPRPGCANPLWHVVEGGYQVHDYADPEYGNPTRAGAEVARENAKRAGEASVEARRQRFGTAQPSSKRRTTPERPVRTAPEQGVPNGSERPVAERPERPPNPAPPRTTPPRPESPTGSTRAREADPDDEPRLPPEVKARAELLEETFDNHEGPLKRRLQGRERDVLLRWARMARNGALVPLDEIVQYARYRLAAPMRDGEPPATLMGIDLQVMTLARGPATNGANGTGAAGERLTPNSQLARQIEAAMRQRQQEGET